MAKSFATSKDGGGIPTPSTSSDAIIALGPDLRLAVLLHRRAPVRPMFDTICNGSDRSFMIAARSNMMNTGTPG